jgi:hypothetical protein
LAKLSRMMSVSEDLYLMIVHKNPWGLKTIRFNAESDSIVETVAISCTELNQSLRQP